MSEKLSQSQSSARSSNSLSRLAEQQWDRRRFLKTTAIGGLFASGLGALPTKAQASRSPNEKLNLAFVGVANKGWDNVKQLSGENVAVLCDVDQRFLDRAKAEFPEARTYRDYRKMLEAEVNRIDGVVVSTADHTHAPATSVALDLGKHAYCEKPLAHSVEEARVVAELARKNKLVTQMGTQIHASNNYRRVVEMVRSGMIGEVNEVHTWCNKGWSNGRFNDLGKPTPAYLDWDLWLGPAKERDYAGGVHPANWRRFWEYGSGTFGDMACHIMDLPFWALELGSPKSVECEGPEVHPDGAPSWAKASYEFEIGNRPLKLYWSDGGEHFDLVKNTNDSSGKPLSAWGLGVLFVGDKGMLAADYGRRQLLPAESFEEAEMPVQSIPNSIGHWAEWAAACKTGEPTTCNFDYSGGLTESVLLGIVAYRSGEKIQWNGKDLEITNSDEANAMIRKEYRTGFELVRA